MQKEDSHLTDQQLLLAADGELPSRHAAQVRAHLTACWDCRARMAEIEGTIADFARIHRQALDPELPPIAGPHANLKAHLAQLAAEPHAGLGRRFFRLSLGARVTACFCAVVLMSVLIGNHLFRHSASRTPNSSVLSSGLGVVPNHTLTPGVTRQVDVSDVCSMAHEQVVSFVPQSLRKKVLREYGIVNARPGEYEIDYLIAPGLGGADDIRNLWPEPYASPAWNAHVKDALEERLHELVCSGQLNLSTAQHDIATNWVAAYKKYVSAGNHPAALESNLSARSVLRVVQD